ncbi:hypothetical protein Pcinc_010338 [Petrolisthes cinctipes]|uniref:Pericentriolar material 1 protein C-terminal domain-containing protein n=1 Tax=Petrolisthes cinctipes TaxID=88211 RepID=A0AAE1KVG4_PETCI|nr:hypothetical protein Pcinc_010338 [Petrolisthes cinctipes]
MGHWTRGGRCTMPVKGGGAQKRVNERNNLGQQLGRRHHAALADSFLHMEDLEEIEALVEVEQLRLLQQQQQQGNERPDINILRTPDRSLHPYLESQLPSIRHSHTRTRARTPHAAAAAAAASSSVPLDQLSSIILNMTFSDAEDEHHGTGNTSQDHDRTPSRSRTESGVSNASTASLASPSPASPHHNNNNNNNDNTGRATEDSSSADPSPSQATTAATSNVAVASASASSSTPIPGTSNVDIANAVNSLTGVDMMGVDSKKILDKLQQVQGYIQQTTTAMAALEQQGDISKVGQYNTLAKVLRDLKDTETKLKGHLETAKRKEGQESDIYARFSTLNKSLQHQEGEYLDILARFLVLSKAASSASQVTNGSHTTTTTTTTSPHINGQVDMTERSSSGDGHVVGVIGSGNVRSLQDRLSASQVESEALMTHMRESITRREDLMTRYKATRERLANLKKQRLGIQQEKEQLLEAVARQGESGEVREGEEPAFEDPIPGAANWTLTEVNQALVDFRELMRKVERLTDCYNQKAQSGDADEQANANSKLQQLSVKQRQLNYALTKLASYKLQKEGGQQQPAGDAGGESGTPTNTVPTTTSGQTSDTNRQQASQHSPRPEETERLSGVPSSGASNLDNHTVTQGELGAASQSLTLASDDLASRQNQLVSLQQQLRDMKRLLDVTSSAQREAESRAQESKRRLDEARSRQEVLMTDPHGNMEDTVGGMAGEGETFLEVSGRRITLTQEERQNPEIASKYHQLTEAKSRLAKMEEVIAMISTAKSLGQNVRDVMPAEYLAILEDAESEMAEPDSQPRLPRPAPGQLSSDQPEDDNTRVPRRHPRTPRVGSLGRGEREHEERQAREQQQDRSEISAMQKRLNKATPRVSAINEGSRHGNEKGAIKKQPQALWQEGSHRNNNTASTSGINRGGGGGVSASAGGGLDPRVSEVLAMQEELKQKKNALEALMRRMGKSSSLNVDNISDNISEGSERLREEEDEEEEAVEEVVRGMGATWGASGHHSYSDDQFRQSSEDELLEEDDDVNLLLARGSHRRHQPSLLPLHHQPKDRNRHSTSRHRRSRQDSGGRFSVNNLSSNNYGSLGRTKHNRLRASSAPKAVWEPVDGNYKSPSNTTLQAHHSINAALSQLTQVQGTINNLQESLQNQVLGGGHSGGGGPLYPSYAAPPPPLLLSTSELPTPTHTAPLPHRPAAQTALTPMSSYAGLGSLAMAGQGGSGAGEGNAREVNHQVMSGLQQCFSQLHLHSLEIQALSKHLQLLERRDQGGGSAPIPDTGGGGGIRGRRSEEEEEEEDDNEEEEDDNEEEEEEDLTPSRPPYPLHQNLLAGSRGHPGKEVTRGIPRGPSTYPLYPRTPSDGVESQGLVGGVGVTNPIYGHLGEVRDQTGGTWGSLAPTPGSEQPSDQLASLMGSGPGSGVVVGGVRGMEGTPSHPMLQLDRLGGDRVGQSQHHDQHHHHWASHHPMHHQTTDLLNNQVLPGTRANNYWDNFRSYSRQNLLSSTTKSNTGEHHTASTAPHHQHHQLHHLQQHQQHSTASPASAPTHPLTTSSSAGHLGRLSRESSRVEDKRFNVSVNNSSGGTGMMVGDPGGGARARVPEPSPHHMNNHPRPPQSHPRVRNPVSPSHHGQNKHKANNRNKQGGLWSNMAERNPSQGGGPYTTRDRSHVNYNYNYPRLNTNDSSEGVTQDVVREAEALMRRHASQPEFLLQLFRNAAQITVHTDQHVAVALLQDLASQPHRPDHGVNANRRSSSSNNDNTSLSLPAPLRDSWRPQPSHPHPRNVLPQDSGSVMGGSGSGSEVSSGLTSEDEDSRQPTTTTNTTNTHNIVSTNQQGSIANSSRSVANSESSLYDHLIYNEPIPTDVNRREVVEDWMCRGAREDVVEGTGSGVGGSGSGVVSGKLLNQADAVGSSPEDAQNITHPLSNDTEYLTFETLVASAVREGVEALQGGAGEGEGGGLVSPLLLTSLHHSLVAQIETQAQSLRLPRSFLYSIDSELKSALQAFTGKSVSEASNDVPSVISQVLLTQYCSVLVQRLRDNNPALPHTPTKLLPQAKGRDISVESLASSLSEYRQEATTATQTDFSLAGHHPPPPPPPHPADPTQRPLHHPFSLTTPTSTQHSQPHTFISCSLFPTSPGAQWQQGPLSAPLPSPNDPPSSNGESGVEGMGPSLLPSAPFPAPQKPDAASSWSGERCGQGTESSTPTPAGVEPSPNGPGGAVWGEGELEDGLIDELGEQGLAVHALAEADQSQDAVDTAEGDWEDSQAEGIQAAAGGCDGTPTGVAASGWLLPRDSPTQMAAEGQVECEADTTESSSSSRAATGAGTGHLAFGDLLVAQGGGNSNGMREQELDEVPTKLLSPEGENLPLPPSAPTTDHPKTTPPVPLGPPHPPHSPGSEG